MPTQRITEWIGVDAVTAEDKLGQGLVPLATNVDFSLYPGAAGIRRGARRIIKVGANSIEEQFRLYNSANIGASPRYVSDSAGVVYRITGGFGAPSATSILTGGSTDENTPTAFTAYRDDVFINSGGVARRDDGSTTRAWVPPAPGTAVTLTTATLSPVTVVSTYTIAEGASGSVSDTFVGTATGDTNESSLRVTFEQVPAATNLNTNGGNTVGDFGVHSVELKFDEPKFLTRVAMEYSLGDTSYTNKLVATLDAVQFSDAQSEAGVLIDAMLEDTDGDAVSSDDRASLQSVFRQRFRPPRSQASIAADSFAVWSVAVPQFDLIGRVSNTLFADVRSCRLVIEAWGPLTCVVRNWQVQGAEGYSLHDPAVGYAYWETFSRVETIGGQQVIVDESAPSPASARTRVTNGRVVCASANAAPGEGMTHRVLYRQGGYMPDAYAVSTHAMGTTTVTDTVGDLDAMLQFRLERKIRSSLPQGVREATTWYNRIFCSHDNQLLWSLPGRPGTFPKDSETEVSHSGDAIQRLITAGDRLVIINRDTVYEMAGTLFEGAQADWILQRSEGKGSVAPRATISTPHGILCVRPDGLSMYRPGAGYDQPIDWAMQKLGDIFKGDGEFDPARVKGSRFGAGLEGSFIQHCCAAWHDGKVYFGFPNGSSTTRPNAVAVLDFNAKQVWMYTFPWSIRSMWPDLQDNVLVLGTTDGALMRMGLGHADETTAGVLTGIPYAVKTRRWTIESDAMGQNVSVENQGPLNGVLTAIYEGTSTATLGTLTTGSRAWQDYPLNGSFAQSIEFHAQGTQSTGQGVIYGLAWDADIDPTEVSYLRTEEEDLGYPCEKRWDVISADLAISGTSTVTAVTWVDGTAAGTNTIVGPAGRQKHTFSYPPNTLGDVTYTVLTGGPFKPWGVSHLGRKEPCRVNFWRAEESSGEERIFDGVNYEVDPQGTVTTIAYVDGTAVGTNTVTGTGQQSYVFSLPANTYGRTIWATHEGSAFKHYKTWYDERLEPDRYADFVTDRVSGEEHHWHNLNADIDPLGGTATATVYVDNSSVGTYTFTGNGRKSYVAALPANTYGRTIYAKWSTASGRFKHYRTWWDGRQEPDRVTLAQWGPKSFASEHLFRTMLVEANPLGGTATATVVIDGTAATTYTMTGSRRRTYEIPLELDGTQVPRYGRDVAVDVTSTTVFKLYDATPESESQPFGKNTWIVDYTKVGGASQLDLAVAHSLDVEGTATLTGVWDVDNQETGTFTQAVAGRKYFDKQPLPPGMRGQLFRLRLWGDANFQVFSAGLEVQQKGVKGATRRTRNGTPR